METEKERLESFVSIPLELTVDILLRLPAKSIGRFRCVSKLWSTTTTTPSFVKSFSVRSSAHPSLLYCMNGEEKRVFYSLPHHHHPHPCAEKYLLKEETGLPLRIQTDEKDVPQSIHGLIPFGNSESVIIWNPTLKQHVTLPKPKVSKPFISLLGYDPIGDEYKVLCMSLWNKGENPQIFTLGPRESWRMLIQDRPSHVKFYKVIWRCINGVVYYLAASDTIKFGVIQMPELPWRIETLWYGFIRHRGRLALFSNISSLAGRISLWTLEDAEKHEWSRKDSYLPFKTITSSSTGKGRFPLSVLQLSGETVDDELIYLPTFADRPSYAIYYDLERNKARKVEYESIGGIEFISHCFPNHIESLMSLNDLFTAA
ncbi:hypothetical protein Bca52824_009797 [Brassica carinata]|uniref:F-box domain-containing protein n=1 Tax=Brassica carinata TaxID=52824 RepID=A0A8X8B760_BRACI|nr:hypothetical protein Bca52824_009797 [Brassica carinata]